MTPLISGLFLFKVCPDPQNNVSCVQFIAPRSSVLFPSAPSSHWSLGSRTKTLQALFP